MKEEELNKLCIENDLRNYDLFVEWFIKRFPKEIHTSYIVEWINRFKSGNPVSYMDSESLNKYLECITKGRDKIEIKDLKIVFENINNKIDIVNKDLKGEDEDIDLSGENEDYKKGFRDALEWTLRFS